MIDQVPEAVKALMILFAIPIVITVSIGLCYKILRWMKVID